MVILMILIIGIGTILAYLNTDLFQSNEQLFYQYVSQLAESLKEFGDEELVAYFEKQRTTPYESNGKLEFNINIPDYEAQLKNTNATNLTFHTKTDWANEKQEQQLFLNYSDTVSFPVEYRQDADLYALTSNIVVNKYVAIRNNNLKDFFMKCGVTDVSEIPNKIEINKDISKEEWNSIFEKCKIIIQNNIQDSNFSKIDKNAIALTLNQYELKTIFVQLLEELKDTSIFKENKKIQESINKLEALNDSTNEALKMIVYRENGALTKIEIEVEQKQITIEVKSEKIVITCSSLEEHKTDTVIEIEKIKQENGLNYQIIVSKQDEDISMEFHIKAQFQDITTENAKEIYQIVLQAQEKEQGQKVQYEYNFHTIKAFLDHIDIGGITNDNSVILNNWEEEQIRELLTAIGNRISQINEEQMQQLQVKENPLMMATPIGYLYTYMQNSMSSIFKKVDENQQNFQQAMQDEEKQLQELTKKASNLILESYAGEQVNGSKVKQLLTQILNDLLSTQNSNIHTIILNNREMEANEQNIKQMQLLIAVAKRYQVSFEYNKTTQMIEKVIINENN